MTPILRQGFFLNARIGMSATLSLEIATGKPFLNRYGAVWEIRRPRKARNVAPIFAAVGAKFPEQREVMEPPRTTKVIRGGQTMRVPYFVFEEI